MNSPDTQPGLDPPASDLEEYFDPDMPDMSEQEFAASLEAPVQLPKFVLDVPDEPGSPVAAKLGGETPQAEVTESDRISEQPSNASSQSEGSAYDPEEAEHDW